MFLLVLLDWSFVGFVVLARLYVKQNILNPFRMKFTAKSAKWLFYRCGPDNPVNTCCHNDSDRIVCIVL